MSDAMSGAVFERLQEEVIRGGVCTHCGTCVGLAGGALEMHPTAHGPLPVLRPGAQSALPEEA